jgi:hypothetical protein
MTDRTSGFTFDDAVAEMAQAQLGHKRRTARLADSARRISHHPGGTLPDKLHDPAAYRATLRLLNNPAVTHSAVLDPHVRATNARIARASGTVVLVHDTTELDYSGQDTLGSLGQIGNGAGKGYECHNSLAVDADTGDLLGLASQILHRRADKPKRESVKASRARPTRESRLWVNAVQAIGAAPPGVRVVDVCDRAADTFEFLEYERAHGRHFVIRSTYSRAVDVESDGQPHLLHDLLRSLDAQIGWTVPVSANKGQPERTANVVCAWAKVTVKAPHVRKGDHGREPLELWAIRVSEVEAPADVKEPLEWLLLTDEPIADAGCARDRVRLYELRPKVEDYHKAQKTGLGIEDVQLHSQAGLQPLIGLLSVLAVGLVNARQAARVPDKAGRPAREFFDPVWVEILSVWRYREVRDLTVHEFTLALGRLGGHLNRKSDGLPGWLTLWRGLMRLNAMAEYELARQGAGAGAPFPAPHTPELSSPSCGKP